MKGCIFGLLLSLCAGLGSARLSTPAQSATQKVILIR